ncbi:MAG: 4Fe-4S dicluster domain-containing protein [Syntrophales bacterium]
MLRVDEHVHDLENEMKGLSGEDLSRCIQCGKCTAGCPIAPDMDVMPNQVIRYLQLNDEAKALGASSIWLCASCTTCSVRCPEGIDVARVMNQSRKLCIERGYRPKEGRIHLFNRIFVDSIRQSGRVHELGLMIRYNLLTKNPFKDIGLLPRILQKGKISLLPHRIRERERIKRLFAASKRFIKG